MQTYITRPVFYYKNHHLNPITSAGIIPIYNGQAILQQEIKNNKTFLSDFGGKSQYNDFSPFDIAIRELMEETNGYLYNTTHNDLRKMDVSRIFNYYKSIFSNIIQCIYIKECKYLLFFVEINQYVFYRFPPYLYQEIPIEEKNSNIYHNITIHRKIRISYICHPRLCSLIRLYKTNKYHFSKLLRKIYKIF